MPSAAEIEAYLEQSAARTKLRLPLAKGNALPAPPPAEGAQPGVPPGRASQAGEGPRGPAKALPVQRASRRGAERASPPPVGEAADGWKPFADDE